MMKIQKQFDRRFCVSEESNDEKYTKQYEGEMTQGSGYMHLRGSFEEGIDAAPQDEDYMRLPANVTIEKPHHPRSKFGTYIPGTTGRHPLLNEEIVNLPYIAALCVSADGEELDIDKSDFIFHKRWLDMRDSVLHREFEWKTKGGTTIKAKYARFISRATPNVFFWQGTFSPDKDCRIELNSFIDDGVRTNGYNHFTSVKNEAGSCTVTTDNGDTVTMTTAMSGADFSPSGKFLCAALEAKAEKEYTITKLVVASTSRDKENSNIKYKNADEYIAACGFSFDDEYESNAAVWDKLWEESGVKIEGDDDAQYAVNFSVYHMLRSVVTGDSRAAICAKGYAGEAYFGHFFWDTEIYLLPFFLYTNPANAKSLAEFRIKTLPGAKANAKNYGYGGARYPWESSVSGGEQCASWQYCDHEVHITADVVFALWHYYSNTGDRDFLRSSLPVFVETSRYWLERSSRGSDGKIHISGVMGPDEYIAFSNDNAYTNTMVKKAFGITKKAFDILSAHDKNVYAECGTSADEIASIAKAADDIAVWRSPDTGILMQCRDFDRFEELDFDKIWPGRRGMYGNHISQERNYRSKALKQPDVLMLPYLFENEMDAEELRKTYDYYYPFTTHDSSLSYVIHAILCARMGDRDEAYNLFCRALDIDTAVEGCGASEGIHIANCGGIWQGIVFGFAGMRHSYETDTLSFDPCLPEKWNSVSFRISFRGQRYAVEITKDGAAVENLDAKNLTDALAKKKYKGVIFDLDGVLVTTDDLHYKAWKSVADEENIYFDRSINERLRGVSRMDSLEIILERSKKTYSDEEKTALAEKKNDIYKASLSSLKKGEMLPGAKDFVSLCKKSGAKVGIGSSSKNTKPILSQIGELDSFDAVADGNDIKRSKPAPDVFLTAAEKLGLCAADCMVVEDADAGVEAAIAAGMDVLAVGSASMNEKATYRLSALSDI